MEVFGCAHIQISGSHLPLLLFVKCICMLCMVLVMLQWLLLSALVGESQEVTWVGLM